MKPFLLILSLTALMGCKGQGETAGSPAELSLPVSTVGFSRQTTYKDYPASIEGVVNLEIRTQVPGQLDKVFVDEGTFVKAGQPIFKINEKPYQAVLNNALAGLHSANAAAGNTALEVDKLSALVAGNVVSDYQLKTAKAAHQMALANVESAKASVSTAKINLGYTIIKAPVSGYISRLRKKQGSLVSPQDAEFLTHLSDVHNVRVYFSLSENDFVNFKALYPGETLKDKLKALPRVTLLLADNSAYQNTGKIDMIDGQFDNRTGSITLRASFENAHGLLRSGNTGKIRLAFNHLQVLTVPQSATVEMQDKVFVFTLSQGNKVKRQPISILASNGKDYLISSGIHSGDRIVLSGTDRLQEGTIVRPENPESKATAKE